MPSDWGRIAWMVSIFAIKGGCLGTEKSNWVPREGETRLVGGGVVIWRDSVSLMMLRRKGTWSVRRRTCLVLFNGVRFLLMVRDGFYELFTYIFSKEK